MTIGERIRKRRTELGLSVDYIAAKLNKKNLVEAGGVEPLSIP
jgi:transcriptional regulator with XRE-family HTH domain